MQKAAQLWIGHQIFKLNYSVTTFPFVSCYSLYLGQFMRTYVLEAVAAAGEGPLLLLLSTEEEWALSSRLWAATVTYGGGERVWKGNSAACNIPTFNNSKRWHTSSSRRRYSKEVADNTSKAPPERSHVSRLLLHAWPLVTRTPQILLPWNYTNYLHWKLFDVLDRYNI